MNIDLSGNWPVKAIDNLADNQPKQAALDISIYELFQGDQTGNRAKGGD